LDWLLQNDKKTEKALSARIRQGVKTETRILRVLHYGQKYTPSEIVNKTKLTRSCVNNALKRMAEKDYIDLIKNPHVTVIPKPLEELELALERQSALLEKKYGLI
jgi:DNA-binding MarR family transcriptional regulator